jgi:hypothetical protein
VKAAKRSEGGRAVQGGRAASAARSAHNWRDTSPEYGIGVAEGMEAAREQIKRMVADMAEGSRRLAQLAQNDGDQDGARLHRHDASATAHVYSEIHRLMFVARARTEGRRP